VRVEFIAIPNAVSAECSMESVLVVVLILDSPSFEEEKKKPVKELRVTVCS
jgi:hypothetical protein